MTKQHIPSENGQGPLSQQVDEQIEKLTVAQVEKWLTDDLGRARSLLQAIHNDKNVLRLIAVHLHGLAQNYNQAKESQGDPNAPK